MATLSGLGAVMPWVKTAAEAIAAQTGITKVYGFRTIEQNNAAGGVRNSDHLTGLAVDFPGSTAQGNVMSTYAVANAKALGVKYVIWNKRINYVDGKGWRTYSGTNPHTDHVHVSFKASAPAKSLADKIYDAATGLPLIGGVIDKAGDAVDTVTDAAGTVGDIADALNPTTWADNAQKVAVRLVIVSAGLAIGVLGVARLVAPTIGKATEAPGT